MFGIPLYSHLDNIHDYIVQDKGAFNKAIDGILNLKAIGQSIEIRCVIQQSNYRQLPDLAKFIVRNIQFIEQVSFMGMEITGFARSNYKSLWVEPIEYADYLSEAVDILTRGKVKVKIFNNQLCLLPNWLRAYAVKSISDWKNTFIDECSKCDLRHECGGFFTTSNGVIPEGIKAITYTL